MPRVLFPVTTPCVVETGHTSLTPNQWIRWRPDPERASQPLPGEWVFRELLEVDLDDPVWLLTVLDRRGMIWQPFDGFRDDAETPSVLPPPLRPPVDDAGVTVHLSDVHGYLTALRRMALEWVEYTRTASSGSAWWSLTPWFMRALHVGLAPFTLHRAVEERATGRTDPLVVDLFQAGCAQLADAILSAEPVKVCMNETCRRVFRRKDADLAHVDERHRSRGVRYCSETCKNAQNQRQWRRRRNAQGLTASHIDG